jgi:hypothetical protein
MKRYHTTMQVAKKAGVSRACLYKWLDSGLLDPPDVIRAGDDEIRLWTDKDVERVKKLKGSLPIGRPKQKKDGGR